MRAQDKSYLAKLGFDDSDRKNEFHNGAIQYLAQADKVSKILSMFYKDPFEGAFSDWGPCPEWLYKNLTTDIHGQIKPIIEAQSANFIRFDTKYEFNKPIRHSTSSGYSTIIGYADYMLYGECIYGKKYKLRFTNYSEVIDYIEKKYLADIEKKTSYSNDAWELEHKNKSIDRIKSLKTSEGQEYPSNSRDSVHILVEVKFGFTDSMSVIQQLQTYRTFLREDFKLILCTMYQVDSIYKKALADHGIKHIYISENAVQKFLNKADNLTTLEF